MAYKYPNLAAEMARNDYDYKSMYELVSGEMGKSVETVSNWFTGRAGELPVKAAYVVKRELFPTLTMEYLFKEGGEHDAALHDRKRSGKGGGTELQHDTRPKQAR